MLIIIVISIEMVFSDSYGCKNGPNYWGMGFPGYPPGKTDYRYQHPKVPADYIFAQSALPNSQGYDGSHYGTHDWIADAALRTLTDPLKNPLFFGDWDWLINYQIARQKYPQWKVDYQTYDNKHEVTRSYFTFLFATQMPDMVIKAYPDIQSIEIPNEGISIRDLNMPRGKWVGKDRQHFYHFDIIPLSENVYGFSPTETPIVDFISLLAQQAIKSISNSKIDDKGNRVSAMQPEAAAGWLGAMTHYVADLVIPAHLLKPSQYPDVLTLSLFHNWFECQLASVTKWDKSVGSRGGPEQTYFSWDTWRVTIAPIVPIPPEIAVYLMALEAINTAYRTDGNHQHVPFYGENIEEAINSGLYINRTKYDSEILWDWKDDIETNGKMNSSHIFYYAKVERLLCWSVYYTACAMQYCYNEGKDKNDDSELNPDYYANDRNGISPPSYRPDPIPIKKRDELYDLTPASGEKGRAIKNIKNFGKLLTTIALLGIPDILRNLLGVLR